MYRVLHAVGMQALNLIGHAIALQQAVASDDVVPAHTEHHRINVVECTFIECLLTFLPRQIGMHARHLLVLGLLTEGFLRWLLFL